MAFFLGRLSSALRKSLSPTTFQLSRALRPSFNWLFCERNVRECSSNAFDPPDAKWDLVLHLRKKRSDWTGVAQNDLANALRMCSLSDLETAASRVMPHLLECVYRVTAERLNELLESPKMLLVTLRALGKRAREASAEDDDNAILAQALYDGLAKSLSDSEGTAHEETAELTPKVLQPIAHRQWHEVTASVLVAASMHPGLDLSCLLDHYSANYLKLAGKLEASTLCGLAVALLKGIGKHRMANDALKNVLRAAYRQVNCIVNEDLVMLLSATILTNQKPPSSVYAEVVNRFNGRLHELEPSKLRRVVEAVTFLKEKCYAEEVCTLLQEKQSVLPFSCMHTMLIYLSLCQKLKGILPVLQEGKGCLSKARISTWPPTQLSSLLLLMCKVYHKDEYAQRITSDALIALTQVVNELSAANCVDAFYGLVQLRCKWNTVRSLAMQLISGSLVECTALEAQHVSRMLMAIVNLKRWLRPSKPDLSKAMAFLCNNPVGIAKVFVGASPQSIGALCAGMISLRLQHQPLLKAVQTEVSAQLNAFAQNNPDVLVLVLRCFAKVGVRKKQFFVDVAKALIDADALENLDIGSRISLAWALLANDIVGASTSELIGRSMMLDMSDIASVRFSELIELRELSWLLPFTSNFGHFRLPDDIDSALIFQLGGTARFAGGLDIARVRYCVEQFEYVVGSEALLKNVRVHPGLFLHGAFLFDEEFQPVSWQKTGLNSLLNEPMMKFGKELHCVALFILWDTHAVTAVGSSQESSIDHHLPFCGEAEMVYKILDAYGWLPVIYNASDLLDCDMVRVIDTWKVMADLKQRGAELSVLHASHALLEDDAMLENKPSAQPQRRFEGQRRKRRLHIKAAKQMKEAQTFKAKQSSRLGKEPDNREG